MAENNVTRMQINGICSEIENICVDYGVNPLEITDELLRTNFFKLKIEEYLLSREAQFPKKIIPIERFVSNGFTYSQFISKFKNSNLSCGDVADKILSSEEFAESVTNGIEYKPGIIMGSDFSDGSRTTQNIRREAKKLGGIIPPMELAPILRLSITNTEIDELGLDALIVLHNPVEGKNRKLRCLGLSRILMNGQFLAFQANAKRKYEKRTGFVFLFP